MHQYTKSSSGICNEWCNNVHLLFYYVLRLFIMRRFIIHNTREGSCMASQEKSKEALSVYIVTDITRHHIVCLKTVCSV